MDKQIFLNEMQALVKEGNLTKQELLSAYENAVMSDPDQISARQNKISNMLYFIGGTIVFLGICIFVGSNWGLLGDTTRVLATLGSSVALYAAAAMLVRYPGLEKVADAFYFISGLIAPLGIFIAMQNAKVDVGTVTSHTTVAAILFVTYLLSYRLDRRYVFFIFTAIFGTWLFFCLTTLIVNGRPFYDWEYIKYRWLVAGVTHMILGYALVNTDRREMTPSLYGIGVCEFLTAALSLGGWSSRDFQFWDVIFPGLNFAILFLSVYLKSKQFLVFGTIYLMIYILKITGQYFTSGFGWALSLIIAGFALIGIGYGAFYLNKKYISQGR